MDVPIRTIFQGKISCLSKEVLYIECIKTLFGKLSIFFHGLCFIFLIFCITLSLLHQDYCCFPTKPGDDKFCINRKLDQKAFNGIKHFITDPNFLIFSVREIMFRKQNVNGINTKKRALLAQNPQNKVFSF